MIKIALFDIDQVLITPPHYFGRELELRGYENAVECLNSYYRGIDNQLCIRGKAEIEERIVSYIKKFGWQYSAIEYLDQQYAFETQFLNKKLFDYIAGLRAGGILCCLATDQEKRRAGYLLDECNFKNMFDTWFISCYLGYRKIHSEFWEYVLEKAKELDPEIQPREIIFFDDREENIEPAAACGIHAVLFDETTDVENEINKRY